MAKSRFNFFENVFNEEINHEQKGFIIEGFIDSLKNYPSKKYMVSLSDVYRPDLIARKFYGDERFFWILTYVNDIYNSPEGFYVGRIINIPDPSIIGNVI